MSDNIQAFWTLIDAGLWEKEARLSEFKSIDYAAIMKLAEEQSVVGLVTAGLEKVNDVRLPKEILLQFIGSTLQIEQRNKSMNDFLSHLITNLRNNDVYAILVKGQGIAQCYEKPLWRASGDVDLLLSDDNYDKAFNCLSSLALSIEPEEKDLKHFGMMIDSWEVELHGSLRSGLLKKVDRQMGQVMDDIFYNGNVRSWNNQNTQIFLPSVNNDVLIVFVHILQHFFKGGIGVRQICDWCRFLWCFRDAINMELLNRRLRAMGIMSEWKSFGAFAVDYLGMSQNAMPFYSSSKRWKRKAKYIMNTIVESGNFGHNRDNSYYSKYPAFICKIISLWRYTKDSMSHIFIFPKDSLETWLGIFQMGIKAAFKKV